MVIDMSFEYTVLPDGSIFKLDGPEDFVLAREIAKEEAGDIVNYALTGWAWQLYEGYDV